MLVIQPPLVNCFKPQKKNETNRYEEPLAINHEWKLPETPHSCSMIILFKPSIEMDFPARSNDLQMIVEFKLVIYRDFPVQRLKFLRRVCEQLTRVHRTYYIDLGLHDLPELPVSRLINTCAYIKYTMYIFI